MEGPPRPSPPATSVLRAARGDVLIAMLFGSSPRPRTNVRKMTN